MRPQESTLKELHALVASEISSTSISHNAFSNHLPPGDSFSTTICSPQFSQAFSSFWSALHTGQAAPVVQQFGFGSRVMIAANNGDIEEFIDALQETETSVVEENAQAHPNREQNPE
ncbi:hypothetical protein QAD02_007892 [Eretmocerus hayati]|uniref:Uncharacterized protein n=1 Tax=Eretmocerus hayati TaxID=131215 RepID=A0ACC2N4X3_9HYME|nr:hypothetical protein QAD02_007892 [Eretmocerus hayati]